MSDNSKSHRTRVVNILDDKTFTGICSCGWVGGDQKSKSVAQLQANGHLVIELRKAAS